MFHSRKIQFREKILVVLINKFPVLVLTTNTIMSSKPYYPFFAPLSVEQLLTGEHEQREISALKVVAVAYKSFQILTVTNLTKKLLVF